MDAKQVPIVGPPAVRRRRRRDSWCHLQGCACKRVHGSRRCAERRLESGASICGACHARRGWSIAAKQLAVVAPPAVRRRCSSSKQQQQQPTTAAAHHVAVDRIRSASIRNAAATAARAPHLAAGGPPARTWPPRPAPSSRASRAWPRSRSSTCRAGRRGEVGKTCRISTRANFFRTFSHISREIWIHRSPDMPMKQLYTTRFQLTHLLPRMAAVLEGFACAAKTRRRAGARDSESRPGSDTLEWPASRVRWGQVSRAGLSAEGVARTTPRRDRPGL